MADATNRYPRSFPTGAALLLRCPLCRGDLSATPGGSLRCPNGHSFDVARQGYVNLLPGDARPGTADTAEMVAARESFLASGHFSGLRGVVCDAAERAVGGATDGDAPNAATAAKLTGADAEMSATGAADPGATGVGPGKGPGCVIEVGAGTGYYLAAVLDRLPGRAGLALDISKFAARRAARAHARAAAVVCDAWGALPVADGCADLVLDVFAPRNPSEFRRVLRPEGALVVVTPSPNHLEELVSSLRLLTVDERKPERLTRALESDFVLKDRMPYEERLRLSPEEAGALAAMGPSARHVRAAEVAARLADLEEEIETTVAVVVSTYAPRRT